MSDKPKKARSAPADPPEADGAAVPAEDVVADPPEADGALATAPSVEGPPASEATDPAGGDPAGDEAADPAGDEAADPAGDEAADPAGDEAADPAGDGPAATAAASPRQVSLAGGVLALLLALLGFTLVAQVRSVNTDESLPAARQEELVRILADLDAHEQRLRQEIGELEQTLERLTTAGESRQEALEEAARRADELGVLAGALPVRGPGLTVEIQAGQEPVSAARLLDAVQELRGAGAEAIQLTDGDGGQVRVVASTYFVDTDAGAIRVDGRLVRSPYTITAVGDPATLGPALAIPGGVVESLESTGGTVTLHEHPDGVEITAVREPAPLQHAIPES